MIRFCSLPNKERERERNSIPRDTKISLKDTPGERSNWRHTKRASSSSRESSSAKKNDNKNKNKNFIRIV